MLFLLEKTWDSTQSDVCIFLSMAMDGGLAGWGMAGRETEDWALTSSLSALMLAESYLKLPKARSPFSENMNIGK